MNVMDLIWDVALLHSVFRFSTVILLPALGGLICQRVGVFNIALEGLMLVGAFFAVVGSFYMSSSTFGVLLSAICGGLFGWLLALFVIRFRGNEVVVGVALNILAAGVTSFLIQVLFGKKGSFVDENIVGLTILDSTILREIPILGPLLNRHSWLIYFSLLAVILVFLLLFKHIIGLRIRGVGQHAEAAGTLGVNIDRVRSFALVLCGVLCGLGGAQISLGNVSSFTEKMTAGRGWIAIVAVMLGNAHPFGVFLTSTLFGFIDALGFRFQAIGLPSELTEMFPYMITLIAALAVQIQRQRKAQTHGQ